MSATTLRRSARIANRNASKPITEPISNPKWNGEMVLQTNPSPSFTIITGAGSQGKSLLYPAILDYHIQYVIHPNDAEMENPEVLDELIAHHSMRYLDDLKEAEQIYPTMWEREMYAASRWFCIDRRILKASPHMFARAKVLAVKINELLAELYPRIKELEERIMTLQGMESDHAFRHLLWSKVLLQLAETAHFKWNMIWRDVCKAERRCRQCNEIDCPYNREFDLPSNVPEPFKPEMGWDSDDEY